MKIEISSTESVMMFEAVLSGNYKALKKVFKTGVNPNVCDENGDPLIFYPIVNGDMEMLKIFLSAETCDVNMQSLDLRTSLNTAVEMDDMYMTKTLVKAGAYVDTADETGKTPLLLALEEGKFKIAEYLIKHGSDVNKIDNLGQSALHFIATGERNDCLKMVKIIFQCGYKMKEIDAWLSPEDLSMSMSGENTKMSKVLNKFKESMSSIKALRTTLVNI